MSRDYRGDLKWRSGLIVKRTGPLMYKVQVASGIIWRQHIDQLKPTAVEPDTVEVSLPPAPIQQSAPPDVVGTVPEDPVADQPEMVSVPSPVAYSPRAAVPPESAQGTTETRSLNCFSCFFSLFSVFCFS